MEPIFTHHGGPLPLPCRFAVPVERPQEETYLYLVGYRSRSCKIGYSNNPVGRVNQHARVAAVHQDPAVNVWVSELFYGGPWAEGQVIAYCQANSTATYGAEYFAGVGFEALERFAESLSVTRYIPEPREPSRPWIRPNGQNVVPDLFSLKDVAETFNLSLRSLEDGARANRFEHYRIGGKRLMDQIQIGMYLATHNSRKRAA